MQSAINTKPQITPVKNTERPQWSVMIPAYNCINYLPQTLASVLQQAYEAKEMQIEVIDDASTDGDVEKLVSEIGGGRIKYYRQEENVGSLNNFTTCLNRAIGHFVHLLHGDDIVYPGYYQYMDALFQKFPQAGAAFCRFRYIDERSNELYTQPVEMDHDGLLANWLKRIAVKNLIQVAAITVKRNCYEQLGGFYGTDYGEDWEMWVRIAKHFPVAYTPNILAGYRKHNNSITGSKFKEGRFLDDLTIVMQMIQAHLPESQKQEILRASQKFYARYGLHQANELWKRSGDQAGVHCIVQKALNMHSDTGTLVDALKIKLKMLLNRR